MRRRREAIRSNGLPRIWESRRSQRHLSREYLTTRQLWRRKRQGRLILPRLIAAQIVPEIKRGTKRRLRVQKNQLSVPRIMIGRTKTGRTMGRGIKTLVDPAIRATF